MNRMKDRVIREKKEKSHTALDLKEGVVLEEFIFEKKQDHGL